MVYNAGNNVLGRVRPRTRAVPEGRQAEWSAFAKRNKKRNIFESISAHKKTPRKGRCFVGEDGFEPPKSRDSRFTVCPIWPLWNSPSLKPVLITCW